MIASKLIDHIRKESILLDPVPTDEQTRLARTPGLRAVVFDIYGTLIISGSGDISLAKKEDRSPALIAALETAGFNILNTSADWSVALIQSLEAFRDQRHEAGITYPEVRIEEVWQAFIQFAKESEWLKGSGNLELAIIDYECRVNPCWPMPGLVETLNWLGEKSLKLGIVSNAQFYTPLLFPALTGRTLNDYAFDSNLCVWSYKEREGKPSTALYRKLKDRLLARGIQPAETLYVGNDLRNDIWPAGEMGYKTALFAGDARSLRWRTDDPDCKNVQPDFILTDLRQLKEIVESLA